MAKNKNELFQQQITSSVHIYSYITNNPGSHLRKICKDLIIAMGDIQYQLKFLEKSVATIRVIQDVLYGAVL